MNILKSNFTKTLLFLVLTTVPFSGCKTSDPPNKVRQDAAKILIEQEEVDLTAQYNQEKEKRTELEKKCSLLQKDNDRLRDTELHRDYLQVREDLAIANVKAAIGKVSYMEMAALVGEFNAENTLLKKKIAVYERELMKYVKDPSEIYELDKKVDPKVIAEGLRPRFQDDNKKKSKPTIPDVPRESALELRYNQERQEHEADKARARADIARYEKWLLESKADYDKLRQKLYWYESTYPNLRDEYFEAQKQMNQEKIIRLQNSQRN